MFEFYDERDFVSVKINYSTSQKEESVSNKTETYSTDIKMPSDINFKIIGACYLGNQIRVEYILQTSGKVSYTEIYTPVTITATYRLESPDEKNISPNIQNTINRKKVKESEKRTEGSSTSSQKTADPSDCTWGFTYYCNTNLGNKVAGFSAGTPLHQMLPVLLSVPHLTPMVVITERLNYGVKSGMHLLMNIL